MLQFSRSHPKVEIRCDLVFTRSARFMCAGLLAPSYGILRRLVRIVLPGAPPRPGAARYQGKENAEWPPTSK